MLKIRILNRCCLLLKFVFYGPLTENRGTMEWNGNAVKKKCTFQIVIVINYITQIFSMEQFQINNSFIGEHDLDIHLFADEVDKLITMWSIVLLFMPK